ncbi:MAG: hypothetical protein ACO1OB_02035 [Archangium sp.]
MTLTIKSSRCHQCGAAKSRPSPTAYVYCDHCGALIDFDFQTAISDKRSKLPGPEYERLNAALAPELQAALKQKDEKKYLELQRRLFSAYVEACPAACAPRVNDPVYREKYIEQSARTATAGAFDATMADASARQARAMKDLQWVPGGRMGVTCRPDTFWALYDTVVEMAELGRQLADTHGLLALNPDGDTPVNSKLGMSLFVQGWTPYLNKPELDALLEKTGLAGHYVTVQDVHGQTVACGVCKQDVEREDHAKKCVCDSCGHLLRADVAVPCSSCGAKMLMPDQRTDFRCPFCETELRTQTWTLQQLDR